MEIPSFSFQGLCTPAKIYLVISMISILIGFLINSKFSGMVFKVFLAILWTWLLNYFCDNNLTTLSWILVLLPFIIVTSALLFVDYYRIKKKLK